MCVKLVQTNPAEMFAFFRWRGRERMANISFTYSSVTSIHVSCLPRSIYSVTARSQCNNVATYWMAAVQVRISSVSCYRRNDSGYRKWTVITELERTGLAIRNCTTFAFKRLHISMLICRIVISSNGKYNVCLIELKAVEASPQGYLSPVFSEKMSFTAMLLYISLQIVCWFVSCELYDKSSSLLYLPFCILNAFASCGQNQY